MTQLLSSMPLLDELAVTDSHYGDPSLTGDDWPWETLTQLRRFSRRLEANNALVLNVVNNVPNLREISLPHSDDITGDGWMPPSDKLEHLDLYWCEDSRTKT